MLVVHCLVNSKLGCYFVSIREDQDAAESLGIPTTGYKNVYLIAQCLLDGAGRCLLHELYRLY